MPALTSAGLRRPPDVHARHSPVIERLRLGSAKRFRVASFLGAAFVLAGCSASRAATSDAAPALATVTRELTEEEQARHALSRLAYGARPGEVERVRAMGVDRWIVTQLDPRAIPDSAGERVDATFPMLHAAPAEIAALDGAARGDSAARRDAQRRANRVLTELRIARVARAVASERQLEETLVDLWANHFSVFAGKGPVRLHAARYETKSIRPFVLGRFRDMLGAVARDPAMLYYLDNWRSVADPGQPVLGDERGPRRRGAARTRPAAAARPRGKNENYARELLELHTLGVDGGYTQSDVGEVARVFTGWTIASPREGGGFVFRRPWHDAGAKTVLGVRIPPGGGEEDGDRVLDLLARHPATARTVATALSRRLVADEPPPALVERVAAVYLRTDGDLRATTRAVLESPEFWSRAAYRAKVKSPLELVASAMRAAGLPPDTTPRAARLVAQLGQPLYGRQSPDGWPERSSEWLTAGSLVSRINFGLAIGDRARSDSVRSVLASPDFQRR